MKWRMKYRCWLAFLLVVAVFQTELKAQDPQFSQFYANSLFLNPAFAGNTEVGRMALTYRNQWPSIPGGFISYTAAYDHNLYSANSGIGVMLAYDKAGSGGLRYTSINGMYAYGARLTRMLTLRSGVRFAGVFRGFDRSKLVFADQIARDGAPITLESDLQDNVNYADVSAGWVLTHRKHFWIGMAFDHLNRPDQAFAEADARLPIKYSVHGGLNWQLSEDQRDRPGAKLTFIGHYKAQQDWDQLDFGAYWTYDPLSIGIWYRGLPAVKSFRAGLPNNDAFVVLVGYAFNDFRFGYSYDLTISKLVGQTGGAHEISLSYELPAPRKKRRSKILIPCAKF
ncbi:MAG: type IX secretion system membrane protein PorP/SprF [Salibacteraceae bacterium]